MVFKNNKGQENDEIIQNRFSAYLLSSVNRTRRIYIAQKEKIERREVLVSQTCDIIDKESEAKMANAIPLYMQLENDRLVDVLFDLPERDKYIFLQHALGEKSFDMLAQEFGLTYKGVAAVYYRTMQKIRKAIRSVDYEL